MTRRRNEELTDEDHAILRSELRKLMCVVRIARPGAIYVSSASAQTFTGAEMVYVLEEKAGFFRKWKELGIHRKKV